MAIINELGDVYWDNVTLLLPFDDSDGAGATPDLSATAATVTLGATATIAGVGDVVGGRDPKFGTGALYLSEANRSSGTSYVSTTYDSASYDWWTSDYTVEAWIRAYGINGFNVWNWSQISTAPKMIGNMNTTDFVPVVPDNTVFLWSFGPVSGGALEFAYWDTTGSTIQKVTSSTGVMSVDTWHHVAMSNESGTLRLFVDGTVVQSGSIVGTPSSSLSLPLVVGQADNESLTGFVDDLRITKGVARYTTNFTIPDSAHPTYLGVDTGLLITDSADPIGFTQFTQPSLTTIDTVLFVEQPPTRNKVIANKASAKKNTFFTRTQT